MKYTLPKRTANTMSEAIALSSPSGKMSKSARERANKRLSIALFGPEGMPFPTAVQPSQKDILLRRTSQLRELAARGMKPRAYLKRAIELENEAISSVVGTWRGN